MITENEIKEETVRIIYSISELCITCGTCASFCPGGAIVQAGRIYQIDPEECICCGKCEENCPVLAISHRKTCG